MIYLIFSFFSLQVWNCGFISVRYLGSFFSYYFYLLYILYSLVLCTCISKKTCACNHIEKLELIQANMHVELKWDMLFLFLRLPHHCQCCQNPLGPLYMYNISSPFIFHLGSVCSAFGR